MELLEMMAIIQREKDVHRVEREDTGRPNTCHAPSDRATISDPHVPAPHPHAGKFSLDGTSCQERLVGDDTIQCSGNPIPLIPHPSLPFFSTSSLISACHFIFLLYYLNPYNC